MDHPAALPSSFFDRYGPWALITGAARGLGREFARQLAERGCGLVLVDQHAQALERVGAWHQARGVSVRTLTVDLAQDNLLDVLRPVTDALEVGLVVCNAGVSPLGAFLAQDPLELQRVLAINSRASLVLTHHYAQHMRRRGRGGLVLLSSLSGFIGTSQAALYAGTKAYNRTLAEGLWAELHPQGVDVLAVAPGLTDTAGVRLTAPNLDSLAGRLLMSSRAVVSDALNHLSQGPTRVPGGLNQLTAAVLTRLLPRAWAVRLLGQNMRALYPPTRSARRTEPR